MHTYGSETCVKTKYIIQDAFSVVCTPFQAFETV